MGVLWALSSTDGYFTATAMATLLKRPQGPMSTFSTVGFMTSGATEHYVCLGPCLNHFFMSELNLLIVGSGWHIKLIF